MMKNLILIVALALVQYAQAQIQFTNLDEVLNYADKHSHVAKQGLLQAAISKTDETIQRGALLPKINLYSTAEYYPIISSMVVPESIFGGQDDKFRTVQFGLPFNFSGGIEAAIPIINFEKWEQIKKAKLQTLQTDWAQKANLENLHQQLTQVYYQALMAKAMIGLNEENKKITSELVRIMDERFKNGVLNPSDFNRAKNLQSDLITAGEEYKRLGKQTEIILRSLLNIEQSTSIIINDSLQGFTWSLLNSDVGNITSRAAYKEALAKLSVAQQALEETKKAALPKLSAYSRYTSNWQMSKEQNVQFDVSTIGLRVDFNLFNGNAIRNQKKRNGLMLQSAKVMQQQTNASLIQQQHEWLNNYITAFNKHNTLKNKINTSADNLRIARLNIKEGVMEFDEFNNIFLEYNKVQVDYLQNLSDGILYYLLLTQNHP